VQSEDGGGIAHSTEALATVGNVHTLGDNLGDEMWVPKRFAYAQRMDSVETP
jgi:hypothetical protein